MHRLRLAARWISCASLTTALVLAAAAAPAAPFDVLDAAQDGVGGVDGLDGARALAPSPDGAHVYVVSALESALAAFAVDSAGSLTQVDVEKEGVAGVAGMASPVDVVVSPDGAHVYVAGFAGNAIAIFARDAEDGALAFVGATFDADLPSGGLAGASGVATSPDGAFLYTTAGVSDAVAAFARDPATGLLEWIETESGDPLLDGAVDLAPSPDGALLYVVAQGVSADALLTYARDPQSGALTLADSEQNGANGVEGLEFPNALAVAPGGAHLYTAAGFAGQQGTIPGRLALFRRSPQDDATHYVSLWADGANGVDGLGYAIGIATTPSGGHVLATGAADGALAVFARDRTTGLLAFERAIRDDADPALLLDAAVDVAADPLGRFVYALSLNEDAVTVFAPEPGAAACAAAACAALAGLRQRRARPQPWKPKRP